MKYYFKKLKGEVPGFPACKWCIIRDSEPKAIMWFSYSYSEAKKDLMYIQDSHSSLDTIIISKTFEENGADWNRLFGL